MSIELDDDALADLARQLERSLGEALCELHRRQKERFSVWDERLVRAAISRKRSDLKWHPRASEGFPTDLPPPLFRLGWEWAFLSIVALLDASLNFPPGAEQVLVVRNMQPAGRDLFRAVGPERLVNPRKEGLLAALEFIEEWGERMIGTMLTAMPKRNQ